MTTFDALLASCTSSCLMLMSSKQIAFTHRLRLFRSHRCLRPMRRRNHDSRLRGIPKTNLQASVASTLESLQSQKRSVKIDSRSRASVVFHGRLRRLSALRTAPPAARCRPGVHRLSRARRSYINVSGRSLERRAVRSRSFTRRPGNVICPRRCFSRLGSYRQRYCQDYCPAQGVRNMRFRC
jgi:hypothetical protein